VDTVFQSFMQAVSRRQGRAFEIAWYRIQNKSRPSFLRNGPQFFGFGLQHVKAALELFGGKGVASAVFTGPEERRYRCSYKRLSTEDAQIAIREVRAEPYL